MLKVLDCDAAGILEKLVTFNGAQQVIVFFDQPYWSAAFAEFAPPFLSEPGPWGQETDNQRLRLHLNEPVKRFDSHSANMQNDGNVSKPKLKIQWVIWAVNTLCK